MQGRSVERPAPYAAAPLSLAAAPMRIHREGIPSILLTGGLACIAIYMAWRWLPGAAAAVPMVAIACLFGLVVWFFRVPVRPRLPRDGQVLSPCDGKVVVVEDVMEDEYFQDKRKQVSIFMSPLNVHINYHPVGGVTTYRKYHPGKYLVAWHPKSSTENERATVVVKDPAFGEVLVRQIAGALARRICTYPQTGDAVEQGTELGFIKFGSRVDLLLPLSAEVAVRIGDRVKGAGTVIANLKP